jgi:hypothetical protein
VVWGNEAYLLLTNNACPNTCIRASLDWERVRRMASEIVDELAYRTPELKHMVLKPGGPLKPHNVLPIGFRLKKKLQIIFCLLHMYYLANFLLRLCSGILLHSLPVIAAGVHIRSSPAGLRHLLLPRAIFGKGVGWYLCRWLLAQHCTAVSQ